MINPGTLVLTSEGYYAIVLSVPTEHGYVDVFACNGLRLIEHEDDLKPLGLKHDSADPEPPAFFGEIIKESIRVQKG
jgi:hypothetical protein